MFENKVDLNKELGLILDECRSYTKEGHVASYIPELAKADASKRIGSISSTPFI